MVNAWTFYSEWSGHPVDQLLAIEQVLRQPLATNEADVRFDGVNSRVGSGNGASSSDVEHSQLHDRDVIWLAGDSSLDNKYWLDGYHSAVNGYEHVLEPPRSKGDVCFYLNKALVSRGLGSRMVAINAAVEASTLEGRLGSICCRVPTLKRPHDVALRNRCRSDDTVVVSIGGNDIAMTPSIQTAFSMLVLTQLNSVESIQRGESCASAHFVRLFGKRVQLYVSTLLARHSKAKRCVVCMIYYPAEEHTASWANTALGCLGYDSNPRKLQAAIRYVFEAATKEIRIPGVEVIPFPLFEVLDGKNSCDYVARVEPSEQGGEKIAQALLDTILGNLHEEQLALQEEI